MKALFCWTLLIIIFNYSCTFATTCFNITDEISCNAQPICQWNVNSDDSDSYCACGSSVSQNIQFIMDSSGSVGSINWPKEIDFVKSVINTGVSNTTQIGIISFSTAVRIEHSIKKGVQIPRDNMLQTLQGIAYHGLTTHTKDAIEDAITEFDKLSSTGHNGDKLIILITDGNPHPPDSQDPCSLKPTLNQKKY